MQNTDSGYTQKLDQTEKLVEAVKNSIGSKAPIQQLKRVKTILKHMGFTVHKEDKGTGKIFVDYEAVRVKGGGKGTPNEFYTPATIRDRLRSYQTTLRSMNVKHNTLGGRNCPIAKFKREYGDRVADKALLAKFDAKTDLQELRVVVKQLKESVKTDLAIKQIISGIKIESQAFYWITACLGHVNVLVKEQSTKARLDVQQNKVLINPEFILNWATRILEDKQSDYEKLTLALMAVTGRRTSEIIKTAVFTKTKSDDKVLFDGQLKQKDREALGRGAGSYIIPTLVSADLVINATKRLRKLMKSHSVRYMLDDGSWTEAGLLDNAFRLDIRHTEGVSDKYTQALSNEVKRVFGSQLMRPILFRSAYTEIAYDMKMQESGENRQAFRMRVLGHVNLLSQGNYEKFGLSNEVPTIGYEKQAEKVSEEKTNETLLLLTQKDEEITANTRAKGMHKLQRHALTLAEAGEIEIADLTATWARAQIIDGKKIGAATVKQWLGVLGL